MISLILLILLIPYNNKINCFSEEPTTNNSVVLRLVQEWSEMGTNSRRILIVLDNYSDRRNFHGPPKIYRDFQNTISIATLEYLINLSTKNKDFEYRAVETGICILLLCTDVSDMKRIFEDPHIRSFWHPENFYILRETKGVNINDPHNHSKLQFLKWALERLWKLRKIYKVAVSIGDKLIRYDPFEYENYRDDYEYENCNYTCQTQRISRTKLNIEDCNSADVSQYCYEYRETFNGYPMKVSIFNAPTMRKDGDSYRGMDYKYTEEITRMMNVTPIFLETDLAYGWKENNIFYGTLGDIVYKRADVSFNQFFLKDYDTDEVEIGVIIASDKLCVVVPRSLPIPEQLVITHTFTPQTWLLILLGYLGLSVIYTLMKPEFRDSSGYDFQSLPEFWEPRNDRRSLRISHREFSLLNRNSIIHNTLTIPPKERLAMLQRNNFSNRGNISSCRGKEIPKRKAHLQEVKPEAHYFHGKLHGNRSKGLKTLYTPCYASFGRYLTRVILQLMQPLEPACSRTSERLLLICSLILSLILHGLFTSQLTSLFSKQPYFDNLHTLEDVDFSGLAILTDSRDLMDDALNDMESGALQNLRAKLEYANATEIYRRVMESRDAGFLQRKGTIPLKFSKHQRERIYTVEDCPREYDAAHLITKGSPFLQRINTLLGWLNNGGFYDKWFHDMSVGIRQQGQDEEEEKEIRLKLTMRHFAIPFIILLIGQMMSTAVFIFELRGDTSSMY